MSESARNKGKKNATHTGSNSRTLQRLWILGFLNLHLEVKKWFPLCSGHPNLEITIFQIRNTLIPYQIHFHFYTFLPKSARNKGNNDVNCRLAFRLTSGEFKFFNSETEIANVIANLKICMLSFSDLR